MAELFLAGITIGYIALVLIKELEIFPCRLCTVWWLSVTYAVVYQDLIGIGLVNLVAHVSYLTFEKVAYNASKIPDSTVCVERTEARVSHGPDVSCEVSKTEESLYN